jgi:hypothetical protein
LTGSNPTIARYNACVVKIYNATSSLGSALRKQKRFLPNEKNATTYYSAGVVAVNSKVLLAPGIVISFTIPKGSFKTGLVPAEKITPSVCSKGAKFLPCLLLKNVLHMWSEINE